MINFTYIINIKEKFKGDCINLSPNLCLLDKFLFVVLFEHEKVSNKGEVSNNLEGFVY